METTTRSEAVRKGLYRYYTGKPCRNGHTAMRYTMTSVCSECQKWRAQKYRHGVEEQRVAMRLNKVIVQYHIDRLDQQHLDEYIKALNDARDLMLEID